MKQQSVGLCRIGNRTFHYQRIQKPSGHSRIVSRLFFRQVFAHFQHAAGRNRRRRGIPGLLAAVAEVKIPIRDHILWQMLQEIICYLAENIGIFIIPQEFVGKRGAVDAPGLSSGPGGAVAVALMGHSLFRFTRIHIKEKGMICGMILSDDILHCSLDMCFRFFCIFSVSGHLSGPEQKRHVQQAVNDQTVIVLVSQRPPCLEELAFFVKAGHKIVGSHDRRFLSGLISGKLVSSHTGGTV